MSDAKSKDLIKKRAVIKTKLTNFSTYFNNLDTSDNFSEAQVIELKLRLDKTESLYDDYDTFQGELELLCEKPEECAADRASFDMQYYPLVANARARIDKISKNLNEQREDSEASSGNTCDTAISKNNNFVRLPKIDLPRFSGHYQHWLEFRDTFLSLLHTNAGIDNINKFHYLRASLHGTAALVIQSLDFKADNYASAWKLLCARFDNKRLLVHNHVQSLFNADTIQKESSKAIRHLVDTTNKSLKALTTLDQPTKQWDTLVIHLMTSKLDNVTHRHWEEHRNTLSDPPTLEIFITFLTNRADLLETLEEAKQRSKPEVFNNQKSKSFIISTGKIFTKYSCPLCKEQHHVFSCESFRSLPVESRIQKAKELKLCLNCLRPGHAEAKCRLSNCKYCKHRHNTLLHADPVRNDSVALSASHSSTKQCNVLLSTALVNVFDKNEEYHTARVLLDNGSTANFVTQDLCGKLGLSTSTVNSRVTGINNQTSGSSRTCSLTFESFDGGYRTHINCFILPTITTSLPYTPIQTDNIHIPNGICLADPTFHIPSTIDILVGTDIFWRVVGTNRVELGKHMPVLYETKLGWLISGSIYSTGPVQSTCMLTQDSSANMDLSRFWELDTISLTHQLTQDDTLCEEHFTNTTKRDSNGRFIVSLPLKSPDVLGDSFQMAKRRFLSLERRLQKESNIKDAYEEFMYKYINLGHMSKNTYLNKSQSHTCFLPHHGVFRETSTTTKLRVVFDASASTTSGKSFNDIQRIGPTVQDDLLSILLRFRQYRYVVSADVENFYRQILVEEPQRSLQQILWRFDPSHPLESYTLNTVTYGTASAPYLATRCLIQLGLEAKNENVKRVIYRDYYVDDFLSCFETIDEAIAVCHEMKDILRSGGFHLRKWHFNNAEIRQAVCDDENSSFIFRFINNCKKQNVIHTPSLYSSELNKSTNFLLSISQKESFPEEYKLLTGGNNLPAKNRLLALSPFIGDNKLIRVGGRLNNSHYDYNVKHPVLLNGKHQLCVLIFGMLHKRYLHPGPQLLLATARQQYWPLGGTNLAKRTVRSCVKCCRFKGKNIQPVMGDLPKQRVHLEFPFLETGVDYAGPVMIANRKGRGCTLIKSYICVFICLASKAVHLELVSDLTKEAYIAALYRFVGRRGKPRSIFSDNGSTFLGTFNELSRLLKQVQYSDLSDQSINFSFIPAYTPHFGGLWESAVKSIKHHLKRVLELTHLNYEEMSTLLVQIEAILNSRPITPISNDPSDLCPLTPSHFLIGRSLLFTPHPQITNAKITSLQRFKRIEYIKQHFWNRFSTEYIHWLQQKTKWRRCQGELKEGTLVIIKDKAQPPLLWLLGRIIKLLPGRDGVSRVADIQTKKGIIRRAYNTICPLPVTSVEDTSTGGRYGQDNTLIPFV